jgi:hypothetical protein
MDAARSMWTLFEPIHSVAYFAPEARAAFERAGLRGFWRGYFAGRAAPLGPVGPGPVYAIFFGFRRAMVERALPDVWARMDPATALAVRRDGTRTALERLLSTADSSGESSRVAEAATLIRAAAEAADLTGRPLAAANADLPWPDDPLAVIWHATTLLREHRGDGHVAALVAAGVDGCASHVWRTAVDGGREVIQPVRGWTDEEWAAATDRLVERGWVRPDGTATHTGRAAREELEATTDRLATRPWQEIGPDATRRLAGLLTPIAEAAAKEMPYPSPIGVPTPEPGRNLRTESEARLRRL